MRRRIAGWLIRLAHIVYRPTVDDLTASFSELLLVNDDGTFQSVPVNR